MRGHRLRENCLFHKVRRNVGAELGVAPNSTGRTCMSTRLPPSATWGRFSALLAFLRSGSAGGMLLIVSAVLAVVWANSPAGHSYEAVFGFRLGREPVQVWINDGLMAIFFLLVGLELRREMTTGQLASADRLAAPALAAFGGMLVPACIFSLFNYHDRVVMRGWAVPVATDIAFALAVISAVGKRVPISLKVFLTALAIIDDLGAIVVIALFYTGKLHVTEFALSVVMVGLLYALNRAGVRRLLPYLLGGGVLWFLVFRSGVHATLSGVALAFVIPASPGAGEVEAPAVRLEHKLARWVAYGILPLFGLANAGLRFDTLPAGVATDTLALGVALGLILGKQIGVFGTVVAAARLRLARLPGDALLLSFFPHMHLRGKSFEYSIIEPSGRVRTLLRIPHYDFYWQLSYRLEEPILVKAGTTLEAVATFDNSKNNPHNPDPDSAVTWGEQTWAEMMVGFFDVAVPAAMDKWQFFVREKPH